MQVVGVFQELEPMAAGLPTLRDVAGKLTQPEREAIAAYLQSGVPCIDVMGASVDPWNSSMVISGGPSLLCDGEFIWRQDLAYFVLSYGVQLPDGFVSKAVSRPAHPSESEILAKCSEVLAAYASVTGAAA